MARAISEAIGYDYMEITDYVPCLRCPAERITVTEGGSRDLSLESDPGGYARV